MQTITLKNWSTFSKTIANLRKRFAAEPRDLGDNVTFTPKCEIVFRGQSNSDWGLTTTLERATVERFNVESYLQRADSVINEIESITGKAWNYSDYKTEIGNLAKVQDSMRVVLPWYEYLVYLRHHAFPSPLLDWTSSPYIAAFFAMEQACDADRCSVYAFVETPLGFKIMRGDQRMITAFGTHAITHARHFAQKASYTVATEWDTERKSHYFCSHDSVTAGSSQDQDALIKITIPRRDRKVALRDLSDFNISHYTLFQNEDAMIRTLGMRAFEFDGL